MLLVLKVSLRSSFLPTNESEKHVVQRWQKCLVYFNQKIEVLQLKTREIHFMLGRTTSTQVMLMQCLVNTAVQRPVWSLT